MTKEEDDREHQRLVEQAEWERRHDERMDALRRSQEKQS